MHPEDLGIRDQGLGFRVRMQSLAAWSSSCKYSPTLETSLPNSRPYHFLDVCVERVFTNVK